MTLLNITTHTIANTNGGFTGFNDRLVIPTANLTATYTGQGSVSVTIKSDTTQNGTLDAMWIGHQGAGNVYNFDGNQVQLFFAGAASKAIGASQTVTTDIANFFYNPTKPLIISTHWSGTTDTGKADTSGPTNCNQYLSGASQVGVTSPTGSWTQDSIWTWVSSVDLLEAQFIASAIEQPRASDYRSSLTSTTMPVGPLFPPVSTGWEWDHAKWDSGLWSALVPSYLFQVQQRDTPLARDYSTALAATCPPVGPLQRSASPVVDVGGPGIKRVTGRWTTVMDTSQPRNPIFRKIPDPVFFFPRINEQPRVYDYGPVTKDTTQPVLVLSFRTAKTPAVFFSASLQDDRPMRPDYSRAVQDTTQPICQISFRTAVTPTTYFNMSLQDDRPLARDYRVQLADTTNPVAPLSPPVVVVLNLVEAPKPDLPFRRDYLTAAQAATTAPVWPQAPPGPAQTPTFFFTASLQDDRPLRPDYLRTLYDTTQPICRISFRTAVTPLTYSNLFLQDDRPIRPDPNVALGSTTRPALIVQPPPPAQTPNFLFSSLQDDRPQRADYLRTIYDTTQPICQISFRTAITPTTGFDATLQDDRPMRPDYSRALEITTKPALIPQPPPPAQTPSYQFNLSLQDDRAIAPDYRAVLESTTRPVKPLLPPAPPPQPTFISTPESVLPGRSDYSRTLAPVIPTILFQPCFTVGYTTIPAAGAGNSYTAGYVFGNGPYTMPQTGVITSCSVWLDTGPVGQFQIGIYGAVSGSQPGNLLALTAPFTPQAGWNTQSVTFPTTITGGTLIFMGALNTGGASPTKADPTVGINLYSDNGTNSVLNPIFLNPDNLQATSFQLGAYATFCPAGPLPSTWFQTPYQANPIVRDYRSALGDTTQPTQTLTATLPPPPTATPAYLGIAISGEVPTGGDYRAALVSTTEPRSSIYSPPIAFPNQLFLNSLGVTTHMAQGYSRAAYEPMFTYTGIRISREGASVYSSSITLHNNTVSGTYPGVKTLAGGINPPSAGVTAGLALDAAGALFGFEGVNEPNNQKITYLGVQGGGTLSWIPVANLQRDTYAAISGDVTLSKYPVFGISEPGGEHDNVGLQFNTIPAGAGTLMPDGTQYQDYANLHNYVLGTSGTYAAGRPTTSMSTGTLPGGIDGRQGEYIRTTWLQHFPCYSVQDGPAIPFVTTETGMDTGVGKLTQDQQGKLYTNLYLAGFLAQMATGQKKAFTGIYEMKDRQGSADDKGFYDINNVAKLSATYCHNMTTVLADTNADPVTRSLDFKVTGETSTCHHFLLQKSDSTFFVVLWGEEIVGGPTHNITVNFASSWNVNVYDITVGTAPTSALLSVSTVSLTLQDHAQILQVMPVQSDAGPPQARAPKYLASVHSTTNPTGPELLPTSAPQLLYYPGGLPRDNPLVADSRVALMSTTFPVGPTLLPTSSLQAIWVPNPDSIMPDWW